MLESVWGRIGVEGFGFEVEWVSKSGVFGVGMSFFAPVQEMGKIWGRFGTLSKGTVHWA